MDGEPPTPTFGVFLNKIHKVFHGPVDFVREKIVLPARKTKYYYYHRRYRRVPTIDECDIDDAVCFYEANEQYIRDKSIEDRMLTILRQRRLECEIYYQSQVDKRCEKVKNDYLLAEENWFTKYGDLGYRADVREAFMKQKHRMLWERRHGPVGTGMKTSKTRSTE